MGRGWLIAAPHSGAGKTVVALGIMRALRDRDTAVAPFKSGPDYIDPAFHAAAAGSPSANLDAWAMSERRLRALIAQADGALIVEGAMGLFDGAADGAGSAASLAKILDLDVVLVLDCARQSQSIAALVHGFTTFDPAVRIAGVVLNRVGSARHEAMLRAALPNTNVFGALPRDPSLALPERHLGLVQAGELAALETFVATAGALVAERLDLSGLPSPEPSGKEAGPRLRPLGQRMAIARDEAFAFLYPHWLADWREAGAELSFFSPLANEAPPADVDAVFLPGGYPELHAARLADSAALHEGLRAAAERGAKVYGECGGYMLLGDTLTDAEGTVHRMSGLLPVDTTFEQRKLQLGYRKAKLEGGTMMGFERFAAHEFHYCTETRNEGEPLFSATDALGADCGSFGARVGTVGGSWLHLIDGAAA